MDDDLLNCLISKAICVYFLLKLFLFPFDEIALADQAMGGVSKTASQSRAATHANVLDKVVKIYGYDHSDQHDPEDFYYQVQLGVPEVCFVIETYAIRVCRKASTRR